MSRQVLFVLAARNVGGLERRFANLYRHLAGRGQGYRARFLVSRAQIGLRPQYREAGGITVELIPFGLPGWRWRLPDWAEALCRYVDYLLLVLALLRLRRDEFGVVHFCTFSALHFRRLVWPGRRVYSYVDSITYERVLYSPTFQALLREGFHIDCLSEDLRAKTLSLGLAAPEHVHASPCSFIDYGATAVGSKREQLTFVSRLEPRKGLDILLEALPRIMEGHPRLTVKILGQGSLEGQVRKRVADLGLEQRVEAGFSHEPLAELAASPVFFSLQQRENYPSQSLLEAMACGNAVIATDVGLTRQLVDERVGRLIPYSAEALAAAVDELLVRPKELEAMGRRARERVLAEHTVERFAAYLEQVYFGNEAPGGD